jgi:hypothetical protein
LTPAIAFVAASTTSGSGAYGVSLEAMSATSPVSA